MKQQCIAIFNDLFSSYPALSSCKSEILRSFEILEQCLQNGGKVLVCGNGGSASDAEHIVGELMKGFIKPRHVTAEQRGMLEGMDATWGKYLADNLQQALPAISLVSQTSVMTAVANDNAPDMIYAQMVFGYGRENDVVIGLSTSGNSKNVLNAFGVARAMGVKCIGFTGEGGGKMKTLADACICVPQHETFRIQELHLPVYHAVCAALEEAFF